MNRTAAGALAMAMIGLTACNNSGPRVNGNICWSFKENAANSVAVAPLGASPGAEAAAPVEDCLRRWAYSLAPSSDPAESVAAAAVGACGGALARWNQQGLGQPAGDVQAMSLTTGEPTNAMAEHYAFAQSRALLYAVQARAGRCAPPPAKDGVPTGAAA